MKKPSNDSMLIEAKEFMQLREKQLLDEMMQEIQQRLDILFDDNNTNQTHNIIHLLQMAKLLHERIINQQELRT